MMKKIVFAFISIFLLINSKSLVAQTQFYDVDTIREIKIYFDQSNWDHLLDSLFTLGNEDRLLATKVL